MNRVVLMLGAAAFGFSVPALAAPPISLQPTLAQAPPPGPPPAVAAPSNGTTIIVAPNPPPAPKAETPPPPPAPSYVWDPGRWTWNGIQYVWQPGKYVARPTTTATFVPGHWHPGPNGWVWTDSHWDYGPGQ